MIGSAKQNGSTVYVYDEKGNLLFTKSGTLVGFTSTTVTTKISHSSTLYTYDEKGNLSYTK